MVRLEGLEPPTLSLGNSCSIHLSYSRTGGGDYTQETAFGGAKVASGTGIRYHPPSKDFPEENPPWRKLDAS